MMKKNHKYLPHIDIKDAYQFITFRTHDSIDAYVKKITQKDGNNSRQQLAVDKYLDNSNQGAYLNGQVLVTLNDFIRSKDKQLYDLVAFNIMPNHVHLLIKPLRRQCQANQ